MKTFTILMLLASGAVTNTATRLDTTGDGADTTFDFTFPAKKTAHIEVFVGGTKLTSGYTVSLNANQTTSPGGTVTFTAAPANGTAVRIQRTLPLTQETVLSPYSPFPAKTVEGTFDTKTYQIQQLNRMISDLSSGQMPDGGSLYSAGTGLALSTENVFSCNTANATTVGCVTTGAQTIAGAKTFSGGVIGNVTGNLIGNVTGNASTATQLAQDPTDCPVSTVATGITAWAAPICMQLDFNFISGTLPSTKMPTPTALDLGGVKSGTCSGATSKMTGISTTGAITCGVDQDVSYTAGAGLTLNGYEFSLGSCPAGTFWGSGPNGWECVPAGFCSTALTEPLTGGSCEEVTCPVTGMDSIYFLVATLNGPSMTMPEDAFVARAWATAGMVHFYFCTLNSNMAQGDGVEIGWKAGYL